MVRPVWKFYCDSGHGWGASIIAIVELDVRLGLIGAAGYIMRGLAVIPTFVFVKIVYAGFLAAFILTALVSDASAGVVLITPDEAQLPTQKGVFAARGVTRGPRIDLSSSGELRSPLRLQLKFRGFGGATIDLNSLRVTYLKLPNVDLTSRVRPYAQPTGIEIPDAEAPPGEHLVSVEIHDSEGRRTMTTFLLSVAP